MNEIQSNQSGIEMYLMLGFQNLVVKIQSNQSGIEMNPAGSRASLRCIDSVEPEWN